MNGHPTPTEMLARLVAFDTTSTRSNLALVDFVRDYLASHGIASHVVPSPDGTKANLFATIGPSGAGGVALSGHTDCVPATGQAWTSDPFTLSERDGGLYGRGTADMKGFLAIALALAPAMAARPLTTPIHLALTYDEELTCEGARVLLSEIGGALVRPRAVIVGEPSGMDVVDAHKSISDFETVVTGFEAHSSRIGEGANAILAAGELIAEIARMRDEMIAAGDPSGRFDPPYTSLHVGTISGGTAHNIIPRTCSFTWEIRALPDRDEAELATRYMAFARQTVLPGLRAVSADTDIVNEVQISVPGLRPEPGCEAERLAMRLAGRNQTRVVSFASEAGLYQRAGVPAIICGPGDIAQAHQRDEYIEIAQLEAGTAFMRRLIDACRRGI